MESCRHSHPCRSCSRLVGLSRGGHRVKAIGFGLGRRLQEARALDRADVAIELVENRWNGRRELQARVRDFRPAEH